MKWSGIKQELKEEKCPSCGSSIRHHRERGHTTVLCKCGKQGYVVDEEAMFLVEFGAWWVEWE